MIAQLMAKIGLNTAEFNTNLDKVKGKAEKFGSSLSSSFASIKAGWLAVAAAATGAVMKMKSTMDKFGDIGDLAERFKVSGVAVYNLGVAFEQSGSSAESAAKALQKTANAMVEATTKGGDAAAVFKAAGLDLEKMAKGGYTAEEAMRAVADLIKATDSETKQLSISTAVFGSKLAGEVLPALRDGAAGLDKYKQSVISISESDIAYLKESADLWKRIGNGIDVAVAKLTVWGNKLNKITNPASWFSQLFGLAEDRIATLKGEDKKPEAEKKKEAEKNEALKKSSDELNLGSPDKFEKVTVSSIRAIGGIGNSGGYYDPQLAEMRRQTVALEKLVENTKQGGTKPSTLGI